jgi:hypothetical protein
LRNEDCDTIDVMSDSSIERRLKASKACLLGWLVAATAFFVAAARQFAAGFRVRHETLEAGRSLEAVPRTMLGQHPAAGLALVCIGLVCALLAFRCRTSKAP